MKNFFLTTLTLLVVNWAIAAPNNKVINNGYWNNPGTWSLNRKPMIGDTITIPAGKTVLINDDQSLIGLVTLNIYGKLEFEGNTSTLNLGILSFVYVFTNGRIEGNGSSSQKLKIGNSQVYTGGDPDVVGPQMASSTTSDFDFFNEPNTILPVKFVGFTATLSNHDVLLQWSTTEETGAYMYELERSTDGSNWNNIAYITAIGSTQNLHNYSYTDKNITAKVNYYRIKQVDTDGRFTYTSIQAIKTEVISASLVKIAAVENKVLLQFSEAIRGGVVIRFLSLNGQVIDQQTVNQAGGQVVLTTKRRGHQIISVSNGTNVNVTKQVIL